MSEIYEDKPYSLDMSRERKPGVHNDNRHAEEKEEDLKRRYLEGLTLWSISQKDTTMQDMRM